MERKSNIVGISLLLTLVTISVQIIFNNKVK